MTVSSLQYHPQILAVAADIFSYVHHLKFFQIRHMQFKLNFLNLKFQLVI